MGEPVNTTLRTYATLPELAQVRDFWRDEQHHPNSDYEHFRLVCESRPEVLGPWVIGLLQQDRPKVLVVGRRERSVLRTSIAYARLPGIRSTTISFVYNGIIGTPDAVDGHRIATEIERLLRQGEADVVVLNLLRQDSALWDSLGALRLRATRRVKWATHRSLRLAPTKGFILQNMRSKHRSWIKRKERDLERAHPALSWSWHAPTSGEVPALCARIEQVSRATYQRGLGAGFVDNDETRARLSMFARQGQLRVLLLEIGDGPRAFWLGQVYKGVFHSEATSYAQGLREFEVGTLVLLRLVDRLVEEGVERFDFGLGDAHYKERFGDHAWQEASLRLYAPTLKGALLWSVQNTADAMEHALRAAAARAGLGDRIKNAWRQRLQAKASRAEQPSDKTDTAIHRERS